MFPLRFHLQLYHNLFPFTQSFPIACFDLARNVPTKIKPDIICKAVISFEPVALNVNFAPVSVCQRVNLVRWVFCHPHISFLAESLFITVNLNLLQTFNMCLHQLKFGYLL